MLVQQVSEDGNWLIACQARQDTNGDGKVQVMVGQHGEPWGDLLTEYLFVDPGPGTEIEAFQARSPDDRFLAVARDQKLVLVEPARKRFSELGPAPQDGAQRVTFSEDGKRIVFLVGGRLVVHTLATGLQQEVQLGEGNFGRPELIGGDSVLLQRNDSGEWERPGTSRYSGRCGGPPASFSVFGTQGEAPRFVAVDLQTGKTTELPGRASPVGNGHVSLSTAGLQFHRGGSSVEVASAACQPEVRYLDALRGLVVYRCVHEAAPALRVWATSGERWTFPKLGKLAEAVPGERWPQLLKVFMETDPQEGSTVATLLDLKTRQLRRLSGHVVAARGTKVLARRMEAPNQLVWIDTETGLRKELLGLFYGQFETSGPMVAFGGEVLNLENGHGVGGFDPQKGFIALSSNGMLLKRNGEELNGPVSWNLPID